MCGIGGILHLKSPGTVDVEQLKKMTFAIRHRGPDEFGAYVDDWIGLGHARLSIIDLSGGTQPISNEDESLWIIFNGEIFNYPELRQELKNKGHHFKTLSDTEIIIHLYEEKGADALNDLNGQFAIAIWDVNKQELFLARDRVGIRPLYYTFNENKFLFASEIKAIFTDKNISRNIDYQSLDQIFTFWTTSPGRTFFNNINELPPGHFMRVSKQKVEIQKYWCLPLAPSEEYSKKNLNELTDEIKTLLTDAVKIRLRADVPVGTYLSGGLDSSGITATINKNFNNHLRTFGIRFEEKKFDEGEYQNDMVSFLNTDHSEVTVSNADIGANLERVLCHVEKPLLRTSPVPLFLLSKIVNQNNFKVVVTGEGADEVFGGYNIYREAKVRSFWAKRPSSSLRPMLLAKLYPYILNDPKIRGTIKYFFANGIENPNDPFFSHQIRWQNTSKIKTFFNDDLKISGYNCIEELRKYLPAGFDKLNYFEKAQYLEMNLFLSNYLLSSQGDRIAMAHSVEMRLPFLDYRIIEYMSKVPAHYKIYGLNEKYILKKVFSQILPQKILQRPKHPYRAPIKQGLLLHNKDLIQNYCSENSIKESGLFEYKKVSKLINKLLNFEYSGEWDNMALVGILSSQIIYEQFIKGFSSSYSSSLEFDLLIDKRTNKEGSYYYNAVRY